MDEMLMKAGQDNFSLPHDLVPLPSQGVFYKSKKKSVKVGYLTASDENYIASAISNPNENIVMGLIRQKLYEPDLRPEELLAGDIEAILLFLRNTSFGPEYIVSTTDPQTGKKFESTLILDELNIKKCEHTPNEDGTFSTILPKSGAQVKIRPLTYSETNDINRMSEEYPQGRVAPKVSWRLQKQIMELNGERDKGKIALIVDTLPISDSKYIRNFLRDNEPSLDLTKKVKTPSGEMVTIDVAFGVEFFRPFF